MSDWQTIDTCPEMAFDVLAAYWDATSNLFLYQRFSPCIKLEGIIHWHSPFPGDKHTVDLKKNGFLPVRWMRAPDGPPEMCHPDQTMRVVSGPDLVQ